MGQNQTTLNNQIQQQSMPSSFKSTTTTNNHPSININDHNDDGLNQVFSFQSNIYFDMKIPKYLYDCNNINKSINNEQVVSNLTMMAWIKPTKYGDVRIFDSCQAGEGFGGFGFDIYENKIRFLGNRNDNVPKQICGQNSTSHVILNEWNHCCFTYKNGNIKFYLNGILDKDANTSVSKLYKPIMDRLCIGYAMKGSPNYEGFMSHMSIWNIELDQKQVEFCMKNNLINLNNQHEFKNIFSKNCLIYLPYMDIENDKLRNFGNDKNIEINILNYKKLSVASMKETNFQFNYPICQPLIWTSELHLNFPKRKQIIIETILMAINRKEECDISRLPHEIIEYIIQYL